MNLHTFCAPFKGLDSAVVPQTWQISGLVIVLTCVSLTAPGAQTMTPTQQKFMKSQFWSLNWSWSNLLWLLANLENSFQRLGPLYVPLARFGKALQQSNNRKWSYHCCYLFVICWDCVIFQPSLDFQWIFTGFSVDFSFVICSSIAGAWSFKY